MPISVGLTLKDYTQKDDSDVFLLIPAVFYNTGAERTNQVVRNITATLTPIEDNGNGQDLQFEWYETNKFMGKKEYELRYKAREKDVRDYIVYDNRSVPFNIKGGESDSRLLRLILISEDPKVNISAFNVSLNVESSRGKKKLKPVSYYRNEKITQDGYTWFDR